MNISSFLLSKIRLSYYFVLLLASFSIISILTDGVEFDRSALTLFSVNSFLYGFYISPIISSQRDRIDQLHKLVRGEAAKLYEMALLSKQGNAQFHAQVMASLNKYASSTYSHTRDQGEKEYELLIKYLADYNGIETNLRNDLVKSALAVQQNRTDIDLLLNRKVYRNEWVVMMILFTVTITFILMLRLPDIGFIHFIPPVLCAGLSMLIVILAKMSTLTHKRATTIWDPFNTLVRTKFYKINPQSET